MFQAKSTKPWFYHSHFFFRPKRWILSRKKIRISHKNLSVHHTWNLDKVTFCLWWEWKYSEASNGNGSRSYTEEAAEAHLSPLPKCSDREYRNQSLDEKVSNKILLEKSDAVDISSN